jgi:hypothetical protein
MGVDGMVLWVPNDVTMDEAIKALTICRRLGLLYPDEAYLLMPESLKKDCGVPVGGNHVQLNGEPA